jgi:hypothetical protein
MPETFGTAQRSWINVGFIDRVSDLLPVGYGPFAYSHTRPTTGNAGSDPDDAAWFVLGSDTAPLDVANTLALVFYGAPRTGSGVVQEARVRVWSVSRGALIGHSPGAWMGTMIADATLKLGSTTIPTDSAVIPIDEDPPNDVQLQFVSDILVTSDRTLTPPAIRVVGQDASSGACMLMFDSIGAESIIVQVTVKRADGSSGMLNCGLLYRTL